MDSVELMIGTSEGMFVLDRSGTPTPVEGLAGRGVRQVTRINGDLLAGVEGGVFRSRDGGRSWEPAGVEGLTVWDIQPAPHDPGTIYAGTQPAHLYRSTDGGRTWTEVESLTKVPGAETWCVPNSPLGARARTIVFDQTNPARCWVGIEVGGVLATADGGASWTLTQPGDNPDIHVMVSHPARPGVLYATTGYGRIDNSEPMEKRIAGPFRSEDGGQTWHYLWSNLQPRYTRPICIDPRPPHALTVACAPSAFSSYRDEGGAKSMLYRSDDDGDTWRSLGDADHNPSAANILAVAPGATAGSVLVGTDTGEVWEVSPDARWTLLAKDLPMVQSLHALGQ